MQKNLSILFFLISTLGISQEAPNFTAIDSLYREDQFYFGVTYNILNNENNGISQNSFSTGLNIGFLRDFPLNKKRTFAIAPGLGFSFNNYKQNLIINKKDENINYSLINAGTVYDKNKLALSFIDFPIEIRWRTSNFESHKFWRVYSGFKMSYLVYSQSKYIDQNVNYKINKNENINKIHYGLYLVTGYNSWNFYFYYGLNNLFKNATIDNTPINLKTINIGLQFYIL